MLKPGCENLRGVKGTPLELGEHAEVVEDYANSVKVAVGIGWCYDKAVLQVVSPAASADGAAPPKETREVKGWEYAGGRYTRKFEHYYASQQDPRPAPLSATEAWLGDLLTPILELEYPKATT